LSTNIYLEVKLCPSCREVTEHRPRRAAGRDCVFSHTYLQCVPCELRRDYPELIGALTLCEDEGLAGAVTVSIPTGALESLR